ncbi:hypothetical protein GPECTOR_29g93 [Gonium pectorale]|uniref:Uncharacterized protein n=1 Tax=Gonium pectorale TaxID=33097 RepID=A0A150GEP4_GONPE|nr:hypothetical protein GPECTOR_29g93 [Gonium pectorale]|eukprot:KXZ48319.1 hypothetical protein GPECTOR_29g93 [Gonium pectorale]
MRTLRFDDYSGEWGTQRRYKEEVLAVIARNVMAAAANSSRLILDREPPHAALLSGVLLQLLNLPGVHPSSLLAANAPAKDGMEVEPSTAGDSNITMRRHPGMAQNVKAPSALSGRIGVQVVEGTSFIGALQVVRDLKEAAATAQVGFRSRLAHGLSPVPSTA